MDPEVEHHFMKLEGYNPDWCFSHPDANAYYDKWRKQYPKYDAYQLSLAFLYDHNPFSQALEAQSDEQVFPKDKDSGSTPE